MYDETLPVVALIYDFDGTLSPGNMQEFSFIKALNMTSEEFWRRSNELTRTTTRTGSVLYEADARRGAVPAYFAEARVVSAFRGARWSFIRVLRSGFLW